MKEIVRSARTEVVRWAHSPSIISPQLLKKEELNWWEKLWVYNAPFLALLLAMIFVASFVVLGGNTVAGTIVSLIAFCGMLPTGMISLMRLSGPENPVGTEVYSLCYKGRKRLALMNRNARRMPWAKDRQARPKELDDEHSLMSVWSDYSGDMVTFSIIEHLPTKRGQRKVRLYARNGQFATKAVSREDLAEVFEERHQMEEIAEMAEAEQFSKARKAHEAKRDSLIVRR